MNGYDLDIYRSSDVVNEYFARKSMKIFSFMIMIHFDLVPSSMKRRLQLRRQRLRLLHVLNYLTDDIIS